MAINIRLLDASDTALIRAAVPGVFDHAPEGHFTEEFLQDPRHHLVAAIDEGRIMGFVSAVHYVHPDKAPELWINEVGVAPSCRERGLGREMLHAMLAHGRELGCRTAWVLTDRENAAALRLYAGCGGVETVKPPVMFEFDLDSQTCFQSTLGRTSWENSQPCK